jgi:hypothetical protein
MTSKRAFSRNISILVIRELTCFPASFFFFLDPNCVSTSLLLLVSGVLVFTFLAVHLSITNHRIMSVCLSATPINLLALEFGI